MSPSREDYIQVIFKEIEIKGYAQNKDISKYLNISKPSVTQMLKKMCDEELIRMEKTKIYLTELGEKMAKLTLSKHRLWETFLRQKLNYSKDDIHEVAHRLEHGTNIELLEALNEFLGKPKKCPHGAIIYINEED